MTKSQSTVPVQSVRRRQRCSEKERQRNIEINHAFSVLQRQIPSIHCNRLPRIKTLRLALRYIEHLMAILRGDQVMEIYSDSYRPLKLDDFASVAMKEIQLKNSYTERINEEEGEFSPIPSSENQHPMYSQQVSINPPPFFHQNECPSTFTYFNMPQNQH